ncbi:XRE family transcriptional regulator [Curtobacterium flaccumfaciens pv. oortii]|nr:XRE family transcriptional regulator [Curtobacterium sp. VKM Ac-2884]MBT1622410.1 XRE family transcriptional regulator [Curtobacterium flaccumfaciens pv. oortii]
MIVVEATTRIDRAAELIRAAREDIGFSRADLAEVAGVEFPELSEYESGRSRPRPESLERILTAARTRPSIPLAVFADTILDEAKRFHIENVRVFGSAVRGHDTEHSDIDLLVSLTPVASLFDLGGFAHVVERITGFEVDVLTDDVGEDEHFAHVLYEAVPL